MRSLTSFIAAALISATSLAQAQPPSSTPQALTSHHTLWRVKGKANTVYLLGSVHFLSPTEALPDVVDQAYRDAEHLLMEIDMDDLDQAAIQQATVELGLLPTAQTLESQVGAPTYARVAQQARNLGLDPTLLSRLRPWLAALTLVQMNLKKMGLDAESGVEQKLMARAIADKKEIRGLETIQQQLGMLANLPATQQREFLIYSVEDMERANTEINDLLDAWRQGDSARLAKLLSEGLDQYPDLYRPLTLDRNRQWLQTIEGLLAEHDDYLVVVGALHLVGKGSVIDLLEQHGHRAVQQ
jgi:uncharacterized protein YbaP (TraB family)